MRKILIPIIIIIMFSSFGGYVFANEAETGNETVVTTSTPSQTEEPEAAKEDSSPINLYILITCLISLGVAILVTIIQANKKFK